MCLITQAMKELITQDNDPLPFIHIAAVTRNVMQFLLTHKQKTEDPAADSADEDKDVEKPEQHRAYVDQRLRELAMFERRARGIKDGR
jgi:hypothetical protein